MSPAELEAGLWWAYRTLYGRGARARRTWRQVTTHMPAIFTAALVANGWGYARHYRPGGHDAPAFEADPADLRQLLVTSGAPAQEALGVAFRQAVSLPTRRKPV